MKIAGAAPFVTAVAVIVWCFDNFFKTDLNSTNIYLPELKKSEKQDSELRTNDR